MKRIFKGVAFETQPFETRGGTQHIRVALLTEDQALFVATLSRNTKQVVDLKARLTKSFLDVRRRLEAGKDLLADLREEMLMAEIKKLASRVENFANVLPRKAHTRRLVQT